MNSRVRQYLFGGVFIVLGVYLWMQSNFLYAWTCFLTGVSFAVNALTFEPALEAYRKPLTILAWILIFATGILFLWVLQSSYF
jgi:hypothetical protein